MLTSWSEQSTPAELSIESVLQRPPAKSYSMRAFWVIPRLAPSPITLAPASGALILIPSFARSPASAWVSTVALT